MQYIIIEDERPASDRLIKMIERLQPGWVCIAVLRSVKEATNWFNQNPQPDVSFMDIQLGDGLSFEIFSGSTVHCPIIFITAYNEYALQAFKVNSIDYLLKPVIEDELRTALKKFEAQKSRSIPSYDTLLAYLRAGGDNYRQRFAVKFGEKMLSIDVADVAYFYTQDKIQFLVTNAGKRYAVDVPLDKLEKQLNPKQFFRINRQFIIHIKAIKDMVAYSKARVRIQLNPPSSFDTIVSTERAHDFKLWLAGE